MGDRSGIEWTDATWNPVTGCSPVSEGCRNCYAARLAAGKLKNLPQYRGTAVYRGRGDQRRAVFTGVVKHVPHLLRKPLEWQRPRRIFVNSMSDLFHEDLAETYIARVFAVMAGAPRHVFQVLTKRPGRAGALLSDPAWWGRVWSYGMEEYWPARVLAGQGEIGPDHPLAHVMIGTSVEDQDALDARLPDLVATPAAVRFLSCEPLLGPLDLLPWLGGGDVHQVIAGGESGPGARPMHPGWVRGIRDACEATGTPFFFKQWGAFAPVVPDSRVTPDDVAIARDGTSWTVGNEDGPPDWWRDEPVEIVRRVGKKAAGRELDGREWSEEPVALRRPSAADCST